MESIFKTSMHFVSAARPKTLAAGLAPILIAASLSIKNLSASAIPIDQGFYLTFFKILTCGLAIQILCNFVNDLWDHKKGADTNNRIGPTRMVQAGLIKPHTMYRAILILTFFIVLLGIDLSIKGGLTILIIGIVSIFGAYAYTAGPYPLAYNGLGELFVFFFFGPIPVYGTYFLLTGKSNSQTLLPGFLIGAIATALLITNNLRDINEDRQSNKRTLAVKLGKKISRTLFIILIFLPILGTPVLLSFPPDSLLSSKLPRLLILILTPFPAYITYKLLTATAGKDYNNLLGILGQYMVLFALIFSLLILA